MKKFSFLFIGLVFILVSCLKENTNLIENYENKLSKEIHLISNQLNVPATFSNNSINSIDVNQVGQVHNVILGEFLNLHPEGLNYYNFESMYSVALNVMIQKYQEYYGNISIVVDTSFFYNNSYFINSLVDDNKDSLNVKFDNISEELISMGLLNQKSMNLLQAYYRYVYLENLSKAEFDLRMNLLLSELEGGLNSYQSELVGGLINIAKSSSDYWEDQIGTRWFAAVQADCLGYLFGWGKAVYDEIHNNGELNIENADHRMNCGTIGAGLASGVKTR